MGCGQIGNADFRRRRNIDLGGIGRVEGALLGGLILAFVEQFGARWLPVPSGMTLAFPFALLIGFLLFRPTGLLRAPETRV